MGVSYCNITIDVHLAMVSVSSEVLSVLEITIVTLALVSNGAE